MRTKALLVAAALAAGIASSMADNVYSLNIVGYVNITVAADTYALIANPLNTTNNDVSSIFANGATTYQGLTVYAKNPAAAGYLDAYYDTDLSAWNRVMDVSPGQGLWIKTPAGQTYTNTFVGEVIMNSTNAVKAGYNFLGSAVPQQAALVGTMGFPFAKGSDTFYIAKAGGGYNDYYWDTDLDAWNRNAPDGPVLDVAQGFWFFNGHADTTWVRNFTVP